MNHVKVVLEKGTCELFVERDEKGRAEKVTLEVTGGVDLLSAVLYIKQMVYMNGLQDWMDDVLGGDPDNGVKEFRFDSEVVLD